MHTSKQALAVSSTAFEDNGFIPIEYTGYGIDVSPPFTLINLSPEAKSIAIVMVDLDIPFVGEFAHWLIWNLPAAAEIPGTIPAGKTIAALDDACQGIAYGKNEYKGPKPPKFLRSPHRYVFRFYALDQKLGIEHAAKKKDLLGAMGGHILQQCEMTGL